MANDERWKNYLNTQWPDGAQRKELMSAVGECITAWSEVELQLGLIFSAAVKCDGGFTDTILAVPRAFEGRAAMVHAALKMFLKEDAAGWGDWVLLYNNMIFMNARRNEVAHSTLSQTRELGWHLNPFFVFSLDLPTSAAESARPPLSIADVAERGARIHELADWMFRFFRYLISGPPRRYSEPVSGLLLRLRSEDAQKREEQRVRAQSSRPKS